MTYLNKQLDTTKLFTKASCESSRKAVKHLQAEEIGFKEERFHADFMSYEDFSEILMLTDGGLDDILSKRSKDYLKIVESGIDIENCTLTQAYNLLCDHPKAVRSPIVHDGRCLVVGYNIEEYGAFKTKDERQRELQSLMTESAKIYYNNKDYFDKAMLQENA